jgi:hypothetical protein
LGLKYGILGENSKTPLQEEVKRGILQYVRGALGAAKPRIKKPAHWGSILNIDAFNALSCKWQSHPQGLFFLDC